MIGAAYIAFVGQASLRRSGRIAQAIERLQRDHQLSVLVETPMLLFLGRPSARHLVPDRGGSIFWGPLFDRRSSAFDVRPGDSELHAQPARFLTQFWGSYVAFRSQEDVVEVFRDPSGAMPCYFSSVDGIHILTSSPRYLTDQGLVIPSLDWTIVAQALAFRDLRPASTALRGISELLPGMRLMIRADKVDPECIWSPWTFASFEREVADFAQAAKSIREAVCQVGASWGRAIARPIVELSGGLDSSIVTAALSNGGATPLCATFIPIAGDSDERDYARSVTAHLGLRLAELELDLAAVDVTRSDAADLPRPSARAFAQALDRPLQRLAREHGADMFFSGGGGDHIFCHLQSSLPVVDLLRRQGAGRHIVRKAMDVAEVADITFWEAIRSAVGRSVERQRLLPTPRMNQFLAEGAKANLPWPSGNPWLAAPEGVLPGKRRHVWALVSALNHLEGFGRQHCAAINSPLLAQPVVEACLRVPTWLWFENGHNRAAAREAFRPLLPPVVTERKTKAAFDSLGAKVIRDNVPALRDMLCNGLLAREGLVVPEAIDRSLTRDIANGEAVADLLAIADVEAWVRAWAS